MRVFIVRPFGTKKDIDFDAVEVRLIRPALAKLEWEGGTTGEFVHAGDIKSDMMQQLLGHRIDLPDRPTPRFPTSREAAVRKRIKAEIASAIEGVEGRKLGIAAAANGADTMFHEVCAELGVETKVLLPLAVDEFRKQSVVDGGSSWVRRFDAICDRNKARILGDKDKLPKWVTDGRYGVFQRGNIWMIESAAGVPDVNLMLLAVWDGAPSGGEGGTAEMVQFAKSRGAEVRIVSPLDG